MKCLVIGFTEHLLEVEHQQISNLDHHSVLQLLECNKHALLQDEFPYLSALQDTLKIEEKRFNTITVRVEGIKHAILTV